MGVRQKGGQVVNLSTNHFQQNHKLLKVLISRCIFLRSITTIGPLYTCKLIQKKKIMGINYSVGGFDAVSTQLFKVFLTQNCAQTRLI